MVVSDSKTRVTSVGVFGSTGSIGTQTLDVLTASSIEYSVDVLTAGSNSELLLEQVEVCKPKYVVLQKCSDPKGFSQSLSEGTELVTSENALSELSGIVDISVNGIVGFAGLDVTLGSLNAGKRLALANKESLIAAGPVVQKARKTEGAELIPVDSEHAAIHQCLRTDSVSANVSKGVSKILLTASGGPFRGRTNLENVTLEEALNHPTWSMGPKITVDSSTLMNKGLEVIEAFELYGLPSGSSLELEDIEVVVHPQSIVHSMVTYSDGSTIAHLSNPDMRLPIVYALEFPKRSIEGFGAIDWSVPQQLSFEPPDLDTFRCLGIAYEAAKVGKSAPAWVNAANEVAVDAFLNGQIDWIQIPSIIESTLLKFDGGNADVLGEVIEADSKARLVAKSLLDSFK